MVESTREKLQQGHVMLAPSPHRQFRAVEWQNNPDQMTKCDGMYWGVNAAHREWQQFRKELGLDSWLTKGITSFLFLMTGAASALSTSEDALLESTLKRNYDSQKQAYDRECLGVESSVPQTVPSVQPQEMSVVELPATIGGEIMLPEPPLNWTLVNYGVLGAAVATVAVMGPELVASAEFAAFIPEWGPLYSGLRLLTP